MSSRFGSLIAQARLRKRIPQKLVALAAGIDPSYLAAVERGRRPPPKSELVNKVLAALQLSAPDRVTFIEAAALDRLMPAIQALEQDVRGAGTLERLCSALPYLTEAQLEALGALIDAISTRRDKENAMT
jgi:transcriptional regulator with XRE-family HTH domain